DWIDFLAQSPEIRSNTSVCLSVVSDKVRALPDGEQARFLKGITTEMGRRKVAYDMNSYKDAPPGFRFWCGPTIDNADLRAALEELEKIYKEKIAAL
ncbi:MAG: phosphoserine aminotransferase, partial [Coriobacteriia bacterium]|nr:phosphoserine aminotransferase [Coriobacteriia bacterium]